MGWGSPMEGGHARWDHRSEGTCAAVLSSRFRFFAALSSALASSRLALSDSFAALTAFRAVHRHLHRTHQQGLDE